MTREEIITEVISFLDGQLCGDIVNCFFSQPTKEYSYE